MIEGDTKEVFRYSPNSFVVTSFVSAPPLIMSIALLAFEGKFAFSGDHTSVLMMSPFIAMPIVMAMIAYKTTYTDCVLRVRNENVILDPPELIHIDFKGKRTSGANVRTTAKSRK
jgi:hypothetical protein